MKKNILRILTAAVLCALLICGCAYAEGTETDWYIEKANALREELALLCADDTYLTLYGTDEEMRTLVSKWSEAIAAEPLRIGKYGLPNSLLAASATVISSAALSETAINHLSSLTASSILSMSCAEEGADFLAASSILRINEGYIMPENFEPCLLLYEYEDICVGVTFDRCGEGVVMAHASICTDSIKQFCPSLDSADGALTQENTPISHTDRTQPSGTGSKRGK